MFRRISEVPEGWYERNSVYSIDITEDIHIQQIITSNDLIQYEILINEDRFPITDKIFEEIFNLKKYPVAQLYEYWYVGENYKTYRVYEGHGQIWTDKLD